MESNRITPIAIIGMNMKFPGEAVSSQTFWELLMGSRCVVKKVPKSRYNVDAFYHPDPARLDSLRVCEAHFMEEDPRAFDAPFFNMSPAEAAILDPQQRGLLEGSYRTFENAGIPMESLARSQTSVFCASFGRDGEAIQLRDPDFQSRYGVTSFGSSMLSNRISHFFDLSGPSLTVDTACSGGLYALHLACQSLITGDSSMSLVCGANTLMVPESQSVPLTNAGFLSPDGRCYSFDHRAKGYGRGEGFGFLLLKPLSEALKDGDMIRAVIRASGVNQDGRTPSITQPSQQAQIDLIHSTYKAAGLSLAETEYVEAHGPGTPVGDPIEVAAIGKAFREHRRRNSPIWIGSAKSNIGHLEGASGLAAVIKTVLALEKGIIPPNANFEKANPAIDLVGWQVQIPTKPIPWPSTGVRRASVSNFGYGGSNAHVILDDACNYLRIHGLQGIHVSADLSESGHETANGCTTVAGNGHTNGHTNGNGNGHTNGYEHTNGNGHTNGYEHTNGNGHTNGANSVNGYTTGSENSITLHKPHAIIPFSAADEAGTRRQAEVLQAYLEALPLKTQDLDYLSDLAYTFSARRSLLNHRSFAVVNSVSDLTLGLSKKLTPSTLSVASKVPELSFIFTGQGAQYARMGCRLQSYSVFRQSLESCDDYLKSFGCKWSVLDELAKSEESSSVHEPAMSQPLCTAIQVGIIDLFRAWGIVPRAVCGHSSGEIAAAYCAYAITRESAWKIAYFRGVVADKLATRPTREPTTMMSVGLGKEAVEGYLVDEPSISVACVNSPVNVTLSGPTAAIGRLWERLDKEEIFAKKLPVKIGYHSDALLDGAAEYHTLIQGIQSPQHPEKTAVAPAAFYSSTTGSFEGRQPLRNAAYWVKNLLSPVQFCEAVTHLVDERKQTRHFIVEIGPQSALRRPVKDTLTRLLGVEGDKWRYASVLQPSQDDVQSVLETVGLLWSIGIPINLTAVNEASIRSKRTRHPRPLADLPSYPFSRAKEYWDESRLSRNYAARPYRRHALLGLRDRDWNADEAVWRHQIRYAENPWILDHGLSGSPLYPGTGMLVMAIEAVRQLVASHSFEERISGYRLENVNFIRAMNVNDSEHGTEAKIYMRPRRHATNNVAQVWYDWRIFSTAGEAEWTECAHGSVKVELKPEEETADSKARKARFSKSVNGLYDKIVEECSLGVYHTQLYRNLAHRSGFEYGPWFQLLRNIKYDRSGRATATLGLRDYAETMPYAGEDPCVIHPTTFDAVTHLMMAALSKGGWEPIRTMMFTSIKEMWISHKLFSASGNPQLHVALEQTMSGLREVEVRSVVILADTREPVIVADGQRGTAITSRGKSPADGLDIDPATRMSYQLEFMPDLSLLDMRETEDYLLSAFREDADCHPPPNENVDRADAIALYFIEKALERIDKEGLRELDSHLAKYVTFMRRMHAVRDKFTLESRGLGHLDIQDVLREADSEPTQRLTKKAGEHLYQILNGSENALQIIFEGNLAEDFYHSDMFCLHYRKMGKYMRVLAHKNPNLRILEVGAGTGSSTRHILPYLVDSDGSGSDEAIVRFAEYAYTDVSPGFFEKARQHFSYAEKHIRFAKLDLEIDPCAQGFVEGTYDVIVAGNVLHATKDLLQTLRYVQKLLRPGGKLVIGENTNLEFNLRDSVIFGLLPGWWMREGHWSTKGEYEDQGPLLTPSQWDTVLKEVGFPGVEMLFKDQEKKIHNRGSVMISTAPKKESGKQGQSERNSSRPRGRLIILTDTSSEAQSSLADALKRSLDEAQWAEKPDVVSLGAVASDLGELHDTKVISLLELDRPLLGNITESQFAAFKKISLDSKFVLWLTCGGPGGMPGASNPAAEIAVGFGRSLNSERGDQGFVNLVLENKLSEEIVDHVLRVLKKIQVAGTRTAKDESEYSVKDGLVHIPRVVPQRGINHAMAVRSKRPDPGLYSLGQEGTKPHLTVSMEMPGLLDTMFYAENTLGSEELKEGEIEVEVKATSLNFRDVMLALGQVTEKGFGFDGSGVVSRAGPGSQFRPGDAIMYIKGTTGGYGTFGTFVRCLEQSAVPIPKGMSFQAAATLPVVWGTAVYALDHVARLRQKETILIHAGAGGVGQAAIQLAKLRGADVFVTVGSDYKRQLLKDLYGLHDDHIFHSRDTSFADDLLYATGGRGADVVLNSLDGELLQLTWKCIAPFGRFVNIGEADNITNNGLPMGPFERNVTFSAVNLVVIYDKDQSLMSQLLRDVVRLFGDFPELHEPKPLHLFSPSNLEASMRALQSGKMAGKLVVDFTKAGDIITYRPAVRPSYKFDEGATYVIGGGLGGLGREIVQWMVSRGARYFLLLSSRGASGRPDAAKFIKDVERMGAVIWAPKCDVADRGALESTLQDARKRGMPPVRGCIQAAMVLDDDMLPKMTVSQFHRALHPKYAGSWNLHELLPKDIDFMIFLSSLCGIVGNPAQANYAAGNTFEDALARYRASNGLKGASIDLGLVVEAGWANVNYKNVTMREGLGDGITLAKLMDLLDILCDPAYDCSADGAAQNINIAGRPAELYSMRQDGFNQWLTKPLLSHLLRQGEAEFTHTRAENKGEERLVDYAALVKAAEDLQQAGEVVLQALVQKLSKSLSVPAENIDVGKPAFAVGVDSLIAVEVRYWFLKQFDTEVPVFKILKNQSMGELCRQVADLVLQTE